MNTDENHRHICVELAKLSKDFPDMLKFSLEYFNKHGAPWGLIEEHLPTPPKRSKMINTNTMDEILEAVLIYLQICSCHFRKSWDWSQFINQYKDIDEKYAKWLFCQIVSIVTRMCEVKKERMLSTVLHSNEDSVSTSLLYFSKEIKDILSSSDFICGTDPKKLLSISQSISSTISVGGVELSIVGKPEKESDLVLVNSTLNNLSGLALAVATGKPVCLCGPVGCGKTALVQHLALITGHTATNRLYQVQLGEEMDSKLLLGSYKCTDVPGEFIWQPGVLTKAVIGGDWLLFEDIDAATSDVVTLLVSLIERNSLSVPGYRDNITPAPGFQMFFTQRFISSISGYFQQNSSTTEILRRHWMQLNVEPLTQEELIQLIEIKFPVLKTIASRMVNVFLLFSVGYHMKGDKQTVDVNIPKGRLTSTRDLLKWCSRSIIGYNVTSQESALNVIHNAIDIFCCNVPDKEERLKLATAITTCLGVVKTEAERYCNESKPFINMDGERCIAGRASLERNIKLTSAPASLDLNSKSYFAMTRPSCCLMEKLACCLVRSEPILLVGETGTGKTSTLQLLAKHTGNTLVVLNMNQQSDSTDLLGGYKPVDVKFIIGNLRIEFENLFRDLFNVQQNMKFLDHISNCYTHKWWVKLIAVMKHVVCTAVKRLKNPSDEKKLSEWRNLEDKLDRLEVQLKHNRALAFAFVEGALVRALRQGFWVLLDEINLASAETLQCLSGLLEEEGTLSLYEKGEFEPVKRHPQFRLMAAMNPATDVGKKQLPPGIRNRFTELFVDELIDISDLITLVACYLRELAVDRMTAIAKFYLKVKKAASCNLNDGTGHKPHYSLRTLCRALAIVAANPCKNLNKSLYEGFCLSFLTQLDFESHEMVEKLIIEFVIRKDNIQSVLSQSIPEPEPVGQFAFFEGYWILKGPMEIKVPSKYILTPTVKNNLRDLVRIVSLSNHPVLLQGDTSVGKTSLISYLAAASGNKCLRINNHEHTDLQEYIGAYSVDSASGQLLFKEGVLVEAMRHGYWIILDELNLAPSDVLEALNRVLDDNRELYIPETQTTVKADSRFRLFATQNPPGMYGGRKMLSRAFRNRFIELHFGEIPSSELEVILHLRCEMPTSATKKIVAVMKELQAHRKGSAAFAGKQGFITLRDLFRWGERYRLASRELNKSFYDWDQHIADEGYLVLAGRVRKAEESEIILKALEKHLKRKVNVDNLFTLSSETSTVTKHILEAIINKKVPGFEHIVWTSNLRKLAVLVGKALEFQEPVLMVGDTGCGKTTICQLLAAMNNLKLFSVNCHQHSESSDFLGGLRPVRQRSENDSRLFEWIDGPLVEAMRTGQMFLADEISLGDDSVLERLNSLLEPERTLLLTEKTSGNSELGEVITAHASFRFLSTMNPGGDYGKKELSPALRNRLTEIWSESCSDRNDLISIIEHNIKDGISFGNQEDGSTGIGRAILDFIEWFRTQDIGKKMLCSIRDIMLWVKFINTTTYDHEEEVHVSLNTVPKLGLAEAYIHGAHLVFLDGLGTGMSSNQEQFIKSKKQVATEFLQDQIKTIGCKENDSMLNEKFNVPENCFGIPPFYMEKGDIPVNENFISSNFTFHAKTTRGNLLRLLRSLQLPGRAILLEGSPGVGKTSLVQALAKAAGYNLTRINLSEQTDVSDLFGADLPVDGADGGVFAWRDGPFLKALKDGDWILLDELNLASQSVLEGLNAVLDHRGELFIPELGMSFTVNLTKTRLFACQNPLRQGGARKGLPASFLNRFTQVYMETLDDEDISFIVQSLHPLVPSDIVQLMTNFNGRLSKECGVKWGLRGAPWEMNLRDLMRWCQVMEKYSKNNGYDPGRFISLIYADRMRTVEDKQQVLSIYESIFGERYPYLRTSLPFNVTPTEVTLGDVTLPRTRETEIAQIIDRNNSHLVLRNQLNTLRSLAICVEMNWFVILVGNSGSGKTSVVHVISQLCNKKLDVLSVNAAMDTMEILGGFEQVDYNRRFEEICSLMEEIFFIVLQKLILKSDWIAVAGLFEYWKEFKLVENIDETGKKNSSTLAIETEVFKKRITVSSKLLKHIRKYENFTSKIDGILRSLDKLETDIEKIGSLNSGGKFEWVDSVLIKCITEGRWLLVENVNLCSPAILDRLNGLLEPGGILTLGEKGVDKDGNLVTIVPHPDFRLFFTMDPQRGDISRAMRNRGVEIWMQPVDEDLNHNMIDLMAIMRHNGLTSYAAISTLLKMHFSMRELNIGLDQLSVGHMIYACFLFVQHHRRHGRPIDETFKIVCEDVYLKSRSLSYDQQEIVSNVISEVLNSNEIIPEICPFYLTSNTQNLQFNSTFYIVQQQSALVSLFGHAASEKYSSNLSELLFGKLPVSDGFRKIFDVSGVNMENLLLYSVLKLYDETLVHDVKYRHFLIEELTKRADLIALSENLSSVIAGGFGTAYNTSLNSQRIPVFRGMVNDTVNRISLLMNYLVLKHRCVQLNCCYSLENELMDVNLRQYSKACITGNVPVKKVTEELIASQFDILNVKINDYFVFVLNNESILVDEQVYATFLKTLQYYNKFTKLGDVPFFSRSSLSINRQALSYLRIQFKWLMKWIRRLTVQIESRFPTLSQASEVRALFDSVKQIEESSDFTFVALLSFSKQLKAKMGQPDIKDFETETFETDNWFCSNRSEIDRKKFIAYLCGSTQDKTESCTEYDQSMEVVEEDMKMLEDQNRTSQNETYQDSKHPFDILPIFEALYMKIETNYKTHIFGQIASLENSDSSFETNVASKMLPYVNKLPFISPNYVSNIQNSLLSDVSRNGLKMKWFCHLLKHLQSFTTFSYEKYLRYRKEKADSEESDDSMANNDLLPFHYPTIATFGNEFVFMFNQRVCLPTIYTPSMRNLQVYKIMMNQLKEFLWKNSAYISQSKASYLYNEVQSIRYQFNYLIFCLRGIFELNNDLPCSAESIDEIIQHLKDLVKRKRIIESGVAFKEFELIDIISNNLKEVYGLLEKISDSDETWITLGKSWIAIGVIQLLLYSIFDLVDPVQKIRFKKLNYEDDSEYVRCRLMLEKISEVLLGYNTGFPYEDLYKKWQVEISEKIETFPNDVIMRDEIEKYYNIVKDVEQFKNSIGSLKSISKIYSKILHYIENLKSFNFEKEVISGAHLTIRECTVWLDSVEHFLNSLNEKYVEYADVITPITYAIMQVTCGIQILSSYLSKNISVCRSLVILSSNDTNTVQNLCLNLCSFPQSNLSKVYNLVELCFSEKVVELLAHNKSEKFGSTTVTMKLTSSCLKEFCCLLSVIKNTDGKMKRDIWNTIRQLLNRVVYLWKVQEEKREETQQQEDSLYLFRTRTLCETVPEEEENKIQIQRFFAPSYNEDFDTEPTLEEKESTKESKKPEILLTDDDLTEICTMHSHLAKKFTCKSWLRPESECDTYSYILDSFYDRYCVFAAVLKDYHSAMDEIIDSISLPGAILMTCKAQKFSSYVEDFQDFYHNSDVDEVYSFYPILIKVKEHTENLLKSWEDNPVLLKIVETVERIMSFEVTSPVSRFLTGADVLLQKLHEWEEVAHHGVSFTKIYENLTGLIFKWRKMEISYWKNALENVASRMKKKTSKWWFHLYTVCCQYLENSDNQCSFEVLVSAFQKFIETSALGEFDAKLNLLFVFHCHYANQTSSNSRLSSLCNCLWNLYSYYKQFEAQISAHIHKLSVDVRKNLQNFVKITRWNDINYWSIMKTVEKTHEQLMKYIKQFQKILETPVQSGMNHIPNTEKTIELDVDNLSFVFKTSLPENFSVDYAEFNKFVTKSKKLCKTVILSSKYDILTKSMKDFTNSIHEDIAIINRMDIDTSLEKEKQRSQAKHLLQQKRKTMADLFRTLSRLGISYRTGIIVCRNRNFSIEFTSMKPIDIGLSYSVFLKNAADDVLINLWSGCEENFLCSVSKQSQLSTTLEKPHQDLGPQIVDRLKGFASHLLDIAIKQKENLFECSENLLNLKVYESILPELFQENCIIGHENAIILKDKFIRTVNEIIYFLHQFLVVLDCCPSTDSESVPFLKLKDNDGPILYATKSSPLWKEIRDKVETHLRSLNALQNRFFLKIISTLKSSKVYDKMITKHQYEVIMNCDREFNDLLQDLSFIKSSFCCQDYDQSNSLLGGIEEVERMLMDLLKAKNDFHTPDADASCDTNTCEKKLENLRKKILLSVQKVFKKHTADKENFGAGCDDEANPIRENHLKDELIKSLDEYIATLDVKNVSKRVFGLINQFLQTNFDNSTKKRLLEPLVPLLNQYTLLAEFITAQYLSTYKLTTKLCSNLLSLFTDLSTKGFCIPTELLEEEQDGKTSQDKNGMGLEDGEGIKDVSDEIESQDQLEGAQQAGQEEKQEDKDCKEEEKGIEVSDDFGGRSQDLEKKDDENDSDEDDGDEDELDKEMGETGEEAESLDQQIWGSDSENEEDEEGEGKESNEHDDRGEQTGPKELGAKDERTKETEEGGADDNDQNEKEQQKEINEMDENQKDEDHIDPYHGKQEPPPEPEPFDLPDNLEINEEGKDDDGQDEENPFDIDAMKEQKVSEDLPNETEEQGDEKDEETKEPELNNESDDDDDVGTKKDDKKSDEIEGEENDEAEKEEEKSDGGAKDEDKIGDEPKPDETPGKDEEEAAKPSEETPSENPAQAAENSETGSKDTVSKLPEENNQKPEEEKRHDTTGVEQQGVGKADEAEKNTKEGHSSEQDKGTESREKGNKEQKRKLKPGESDMNRSLAEANESARKRLKTIDSRENQQTEEDEAVDESEGANNEADLYQHIKESEKGTTETIDAATKEQAEKQPIVDEKGEELKEDEDVEMHESDEECNKDDIMEQNPDKIISSKKDNKRNNIEGEVVDDQTEVDEVKVEGDYVETMTVERGFETTFHTQEHEDEEKRHELTIEYIESLKNKVQEQLSTWNQTPALEEASTAWEMFSAITSNLSQELSEQLRLVLEPTLASRLRGDFRTGRRINMRKVIPYIASQFRKDKIWLRRTKPSKREYQIILAIDDSSSMADNHSKELAFESVALVSKALNLIEAGELGVISFGEKTRILHPLGEPFTTQTGAKLIRDFTFDEVQTKIADAIHAANGIFLTRGSSNHAIKSAQLLVIVSDGRGITGEGVSTVKSAVRTAKQAGIFVVFIIIDNPNAKNSILDIRMPIFQGNKLMGIQNYIDNFPFPFYLLLRDINKLPGVLSDALRQWFELVISSND
ncbi:midasin [Planococcus citri]|uniref:midasin n=1 Tax=Planococcus citri TaxID=170843 RepID=UPI0031FA3A7C